MFTEFPNLQSKRLLLRPIRESDADELFAYRSQRKAHQYQGWIPESREDAVAYIGRMPGKFNLPGHWYQLAIEWKEKPGLIGDLGIHCIDAAGRHCELGISLSSEVRKRGIAREALEAIIRELRDRFQKQLITVSIDPRNQPSLRLFHRLGLYADPVFDQLHPVNEAYPDDLVLGMWLEG